jgi:beta-mannanase
MHRNLKALFLLSVAVLFAFFLYRMFFDRSANAGPKPLLREVVTVAGADDHSALIGAQSYLLQWWNASPNQAELDDFYNLIDQSEPLVLTIHALAEPGLADSYGANLNATLRGDYDQRVKQLAGRLKAHRAPVYLRWGEAMEVDAQDYPWQLKYHKLYTDAYRHFVTTARAVNPDLKFIWGPAGYPGLEEYWPGADVVDVISVDVAHDSEAPPKPYPPYTSPGEELYREVHRLRFFDKPIAVFAVEDVHATEIQEGLEAAVQAQAPLADIPLGMEALNEEEKSNFRIGVYDPKDRLTGLDGVTVEHLFVNWADLEQGPFRTDLQDALDRGHEVIVTAEPFKDAEANHDRQVLSKMQHGQYDTYIRDLYEILAQADQTIYLRFAHEMEIPIERYPWQSQDPIEYIMAYRYFMNFPDTFPANIKRVWGPAGDRGSMEFYPGGDVVDYVSIAIYGLPDKNITDHEQQESFERIFKRKRHRVALSGKPLFITEFGVKGPEDFQAFWLREAAEVLRPQKAEIYGACYFNLYDNPDVWGEGIPAPDWSVEAETFEAFIATLGE